MSDLTEEFLNEDDGDFAEVAEADEAALLQDDEDVLNLVPEEDINETLDESRTNVTDSDSNKADREKFATERQKKSLDLGKFGHQQGERRKAFVKQNGRRNGRGGFIHGRKFFNRNNIPGKNKTVLINPRFQGVVHVNNNARLAWDNNQGVPQQHCPINPWSNGMGPHVQPPPPMQIPPIQNFPDHQQHMQGPGPQLQFIPPSQQTFVSQSMQQGIHQQTQPIQNQPYWDSPNNHYPPIQNHNQWSYPGHAPPPDNYMQNNAQGPPMMINTSQPPPQFSTHHQQNQPLHFIPPSPNLPNNSNMNHQHNYNNRGYRDRPVNRKNMSGNFGQLRKKVHERLGLAKLSTKQKNDERMPVVTAVRLTNVTTVKIEEDEQTRDLRLKIEEQKRKREEILKWKEERRLQNLKHGTQDTRPEPESAEPKQEPKMPQQQFKMKKHANNIVVTNGYSKKVTKYQKNVKSPNSSNNSKSLEVVADVKQEADLELDSKHLSSFLADRKVLTKDETLMPTRKVVIKNMSTSTSNKKILEICANIGEVQTLQRDLNERQATILFKSVASAHNFFKKYQRYMLDLSMIEVSLSPMLESE